MKDVVILLLYLVLILLLIRLSWTDIKGRIISNKIILYLFLVIVPLAWIQYGNIFVIPALIALFIGFLLFSLKIIGAGDIKLIAVLMLAIPSDQVFSFFFFTTFSGLLVIIIGWIFFRKSIRQDGLPYGVAISLGFLINLVLFSLSF